MHIESEHAATDAEISKFSLVQAKPNCLIFLDNDTVVVGGESKEAQVCKPPRSYAELILCIN